MNDLFERIHITRQRLDGYRRFDRKSKPCGKGWIPFNKKCQTEGGAKNRPSGGHIKRGEAAAISGGLGALAVGGVILARRNNNKVAPKYLNPYDERHNQNMENHKKNMERLSDESIKAEVDKAKQEAFSKSMRELGDEEQVRRHLNDPSYEWKF